MAALIVLLAAAWADEATGFELVREVDGCAIAMRPETADAGAAMRADCVWSDVDYGRFDDLLGRYEGYSDFVWPIQLARVERVESQRTLVYQRQRIFGIADREVLLWMQRTDNESGCSYSWTAAQDEPLELAKGAVRTPRNDGFWRVEPAPDGGVHVVHEVAVDAGGRVPRWLVAMVRTRGFTRVMTDVHALAKAAPAADP